MAVLPTVNGDVNGWGTILNTWLLVAHNADGTLKSANADGFPSGTVMVFKQNAAPTSWTRLVDAALTDSAMILRTNSEVPSTGGTWTVAGLTNNAPTLTMASYTPTGTVTQPTFTGNALATHQHDMPISRTGSDYVFANANPYGTGGNHTADRILTSGAGPGGLVASVRVSSTSAGTPTGTVSQPTFAGDAAVLTGTVAAPTITSAGTWRPKFIEAILATKN